PRPEAAAGAAEWDESAEFAARDAAWGEPAEPAEFAASGEAATHAAESTGLAASGESDAAGESMPSEPIAPPEFAAPGDRAATDRAEPAGFAAHDEPAPPEPAAPHELAARHDPAPPEPTAPGDYPARPHPAPADPIAPPEHDMEPVVARVPHGEGQAAVRARARRAAWEVTDEWAAGDPAPPHGDPLAPDAPPDRVPHEDPEPAEAPPPHGDPLVPDDDDDERPAATRAWTVAARTATANGHTASAERPRLGLRARRGEEPSARALGRDLPPLPPRTAARQPPAPPRRPRSGPTAPPARGPEPRHRPRWILRFFALVALGAAAVVIAFLVMLFQPFKGPGHGEVRLTIPSGSTARQIGSLLEARGVVADGRLFAVRAALAGKRGDFKSGAFALKRDMSYADAIAVLTTNPGAAPTVSVTIPEGRSRRETAPLLRQAGIRGDYLAATSRRPPAALGAPRAATSLEGFLFPATYELPKRKATAQELVDEQLKAFRANFAKADLRRARRGNLTRYDVLTIASMVEREAQVPRDRRLIAAVIYNRLKDGIPLSIDATIRYATGNWTNPLRQSELDRDSPYNLRKHTGLPPTPIGNPGLASIQAAANPAHVPYLYYVLKPCAHGAHAFSATDAQFQRDVRAYNAMRARLGGRSPVDC
ncbi:MAG TPA: endolytic transglycosylase MltG, partial [Solirubrobacteraceae bacterium]